MLEKEQPKVTKNPLVELVQLLQNVETDTPEAILNETSMVNAEGERVKY